MVDDCALPFLILLNPVLPQADEEQGWLYNLGLWLLQSGHDKNDEVGHDGDHGGDHGGDHDRDPGDN